MRACQTNVARFVHVVCRFVEITDIFSGLGLPLSDTYSRIKNKVLVQIKVLYDYYSQSKRITPFFIREEELLEYDFQAFKEHRSYSSNKWIQIIYSADDLVLISHSAKVLSEYGNNCLLPVNLKKTKVMIFPKKHRKTVLDQHCFRILYQRKLKKL